MPYLALNEFDEEITSYQCRDEFLRNGTQYTAFRCPFCGMKYFASSIYGDAKAGKAPHFSLYKGTRHIGDCNGEPVLVETTPQASMTAKKVVKRDYDIPEKLVPKRERREVAGSKGEDQKTPPSAEEIRRRRHAAGKTYGVLNKHTSSLLQNFVEAKRFLIAQGYKKARNDGLNDKDQKNLIKTLTSSYPLDLFGDKLNYQTAFWGATRIRHGDSARIFHADGGNVRISPTDIEISSAPRTPGQGTTTAIVRVGAHPDLKHALPIAHRKLIEQLEDAAHKGLSIKWNAYGKMHPSPDGTAQVLTLQSLDHLYIGS